MTATVWDALQAVLRSDPAAPRVTFYERTPGPTSGERVELSGKVLVNWVSKAANLLSEELDVSAGSRVGVYLPAAHWRTMYWCLAAWSVGASVTFVDSDAGKENDPQLADVDVLVTDMPDEGFVGDQVVVTLAMLARSAAVAVPPGAIDEARELSTFSDVFTPFAVPAGGGVALMMDDDEVALRDLLQEGERSSTRVYLPHPTPLDMVQILAADGGVVLVRGELADDELVALLAPENLSPA